ncbi:MAG: hypothetical protein WDO56_06545 [Gammaproteobacteria bacterium]
MSRKLGMAALVLVATCTSHAESRDNLRLAAAAQPIVLRFNWGAQLDADVVAIREELHMKRDSERVLKLEAHFHLHAIREGQRYVLTFSDLTMSFDGQPLTQEAQPAILGPLTGLVLNYDIAANGDFVGLRDLDRLQSFTEQTYLAQNAQLRRQDRPSQPELDLALKSRSAPEVMQLDASRTWGALAGMWAGLELTEGKPLVSESTVTVPVVNLPVIQRSRFELVRREACGPGERGRSCVRLRANSRPDAAQIAAALERLKQHSGDAEPVAGSMLVEDRFELLTDPDTLKPRWAEWIRGADMSGLEDGKDRVQSRQSTKTTMTFDYSGKR